jgi:hypothetical protein
LQKTNFVLLSCLSAVMWSADSAHRFSYSGPLTGPSSQPPRSIAEQFLRLEARSWGLDDEDIAGAYIAKEYPTAHNGVTHFIFRQQFGGLQVLNAVWKVNIDSDGRVINSGGRLAKRPQGQAPSIESGSLAVRAAVREVNPGIDGSYLAGSRSSESNSLRFLRGGFANELEGRPVWYENRGTLRPAWLVTVPAADGIDRYITIVDAASQKLLGKDNLTRYYQAQPPARGLVFERESPQPRQVQGVLSTGPRPYVQRTLQPFTADPVASPKGWVDGTATSGNNVIAGHNPLGQFQLTDPVPAVAPDRNFSFPLELGPDAPNPTNFKDAATTNLFYWTNKAHDRFYALGFDEAAGNFQQDNFGRGGVGGDPLRAYSQFGVAAPNAAVLNNASYMASRGFEDGGWSSIQLYIAGSFQNRLFTDGSYDAEVITHEYTHGVVDRLLQSSFSGLQSRAMHEAWSDYFAFEFTLPEGAPPDGVYAGAEYMSQQWGNGSRTRPYSTNLDVNPLTYANYARVSGFGPEEHADGEIWFLALWDARANLIRQFGEREGRLRMATLVLDAIKLMPPQPTMVDARDALLLADRTGFRGESARELWVAFAKRGLGTTAFSASANANNVTASFDPPSSTGVLRFEHSDYVLDEPVRLILHDANNPADTALVQLTSSSGDVSSLVLRREGETFQGITLMQTNGNQVKLDPWLDVVPGDFMSAYYVDANTGSGSRLIETTVPVKVGYTFTRQPAAPLVVSGTERPLFPLQPGVQVLNQTGITLPFAFPFYGRQHRTVWVQGDGYIAFDTPSYLSCNDTSAASQIALVAPMWMELLYGGMAQPNENVYYSTGPGSVTLRWAAETVSSREPVNFSLVLYEDGRMLFQYGSGNINLVNSPVFGCNTQTPFIGLSNGRGTLVQTVEEYSGFSNLRGATPVLVEPPFNNSSVPVVRIETPENGATYSGVVTVRGVAYDPEASIARLNLLIDGVPRRAITLNQERADFCATQRVRDCPRVGFLLTLDVRALRLTPGEHALQILATNSRGAFQKFPEQPLRFNVEAGQSRQPVGAIDVPAAGATLSATTPVRGWVYAPDLRIMSVDVIINGVTYGQAQYGLRRDDVCATLTERPPNCPNVGFMFNLNTAAGAVQLPNGESSLQVRARDESGRFTLIPETPVRVVIENETSEPPQGVLLSPGPNQRLSGVVNIWGWAWDPDGTIRSAELIVGNTIYMQLGYGDERAAQCASLPNVAACPNIGFWGDFDTRRLPNGLHLLSVRVRDDKGRTTIIPAPTGLNVFVQND